MESILEEKEAFSSANISHYLQEYTIFTYLLETRVLKI